MSDQATNTADANTLATMGNNTVIFPLPTSADLSSLSSVSDAVDLFLRLRLLLPLNRPCPICSAKTPHTEKVPLLRSSPHRMLLVLMVFVFAVVSVLVAGVFVLAPSSRGADRP